MAITANALTAAADGTNASSYVTASITPGADRLVLLAVASTSNTGAVPAATATGNGLTWVQVGFFEFDNGGTRYGITLLRAMGASPSAGAVTITTTSSLGTAWSIVEFDGVDTSGANGSGAVLQATASTDLNTAATSGSVTLGSFASGNNGTFLAVVHETAEAATFPTLTLLNGANAGGPGNSIYSGWSASNDTTPDAAWTTSAIWGAIALELVAAAGGTTVNGEATLTGASTVAVAATQQVIAALSGAGTVAALTTQQAIAALTGAGALTATVTQQAGTSLAGAGTLAAVNAGFGPPANLTALVISSTQIDLSWAATPDASGYDVARGGTVIATDVAATSYQATGLDPSTEYVFDVFSVHA